MDTKTRIIIIFLLLFSASTFAQAPMQYKDSIFKEISLFNFNKGDKMILFSKCTFEKILHVSFIDTDTLLFKDCMFKESLTLQSKRTQLLKFENCSFGNSEIYFVGINSSIPNIVHKFEFSDSVPDKIAFVSATSIDTLDFWEVRTIKNQFSISGIIPASTKNSSPCETVIRIYPDIAEKVLFDYSKYKLDIPPYLEVLAHGNIIPLGYSDSFRLFSKLLEGQRKGFFMEGIEKADIDLHETRLKRYNHLDDRLSKIIWKYTYDKERIFLWTLLFFGISYIINFMFFKLLATEVFVIEKIKERIDKLSPYYCSFIHRYWNGIALSFFYTSIIFWGIKLDIDKFKFKHKFWTVYIFISYLIGLVCIFFVGSYVYLKLI